MSLIQRLELSPLQVEAIVLEWYRGDMCSTIFKDENNVDLEEHLIEMIEISTELKEYGTVDLITNLSNRLIMLLLPYFQLTLNTEMMYEDLYVFPIKDLVEIDFEILSKFDRIGEKSIYEIQELIKKVTIV